MTNTFTLRPETAADRADVATVLARSYLGHGAAAIAMVSSLRELPGFKPELSLVGTIHNKVSAFAVLTPVQVGGKAAAALLLAPIAIDPQNTEASAASWVNVVLTEVARQGHRYVLVQGEPGVYLPHGFVPARDHGINGNNDDDDSLLLLKDITPTTPITLKGEVEYPHV